MKIVSLLLILSGAAGGDEVVARVNGAALTRSAVASRQTAARSARGAPTAEQALDSLVDEVLLADEGRRAGLDKSPEVVERVRAEVRRAASDLLVAKDFAAKNDPPEARLREMFESLADAVMLESLTFETREAAQAVVGRIAKGAKFADEAKGAIVSQVYANPETAPVMMRGQLDPALAKAIFAAPKGTVVGPLELRLGWGVARSIRVAKGTDEEYQARRPGLLARAREQDTRERVRHVVGALRGRADVKIDEAFLKGLKGRDATPAQLDTVVATVKGEPLRYREVHAMVSALGTDGHMAGPTVRIQLAGQRVDAMLLEQLAIERGHGDAPEVAARRADFERAALADAARRRIEASTPPPSEGEIEAFYRRNAKEFGRPFAQVLPAAAALAKAEKQQHAVAARLAQLRKQASISVDRDALARASAAR